MAIYSQPISSLVPIPAIHFYAQSGGGGNGAATATVEAGCSGQFTSAFGVAAAANNSAIVEVETAPALTSLDGCQVTFDYGTGVSSVSENYTLPDGNCAVTSFSGGIFSVSCQTSQTEDFACTVDCSGIDYGTSAVSGCAVIS